MKFSKIWKLYIDNSVTDHRIEYLKNIGCDLEIFPLQTEDIYSSCGKLSYRIITEAPYIKITTTCEKQEIVLKLKFGDDLILLEFVYESME